MPIIDINGVIEFYDFKVYQFYKFTEQQPCPFTDW